MDGWVVAFALSNLVLGPPKQVGKAKDYVGKAPSPVHDLVLRRLQLSEGTAEGPLVIRDTITWKAQRLTRTCLPGIAQARTR